MLRQSLGNQGDGFHPKLLKSALIHQQSQSAIALSALETATIMPSACFTSKGHSPQHLLRKMAGLGTLKGRFRSSKQRKIVMCDGSTKVESSWTSLYLPINRSTSASEEKGTISVGATGMCRSDQALVPASVSAPVPTLASSLLSSSRSEWSWKADFLRGGGSRFRANEWSSLQVTNPLNKADEGLRSSLASLLRSCFLTSLLSAWIRIIYIVRMKSNGYYIPLNCRPTRRSCLHRRPDRQTGPHATRTPPMRAIPYLQAAGC